MNLVEEIIVVETSLVVLVWGVTKVMEIKTVDIKDF